MKFGFSIPGVTLTNPEQRHSWETTVTTQDMLHIARKADELGFDWLSVPEHVVILQGMLEAFGPRWPHATTALAFFGGATKRIRLATGVTVTTLHHPVELAKMYSTLDYLSGGRAIVGIGVGYVRREFAIMNADHTDRGAIADEYIDAMIELWTSDDPTFKGRYVQFERIAFEPKPVQKPYPPIWVGGATPRSMRRAARIGDGWWPWNTSRADLPARMAYIHEQPGFAERTRPFDVIMPLFESKMDHRHNILQRARVSTSRDEILEEVGQLKKVGATGAPVTFEPTRSVDEFVEGMERFAEEIFPAARD